MNTSIQNTTNGKVDSHVSNPLVDKGFASAAKVAGDPRKSALAALALLQRPRPNKQNYPADYWEACSVHGCFCSDPKCPYAGVCESQWQTTRKVPAAVLDMLQIGNLDAGNNYSYIQQSGFRLGVVQDLLTVMYSEAGKHGRLGPDDVAAKSARGIFHLLAAVAFADKLHFLDLEGFLVAALTQVAAPGKPEAILRPDADVEEVAWAVLTTELLGVGPALPGGLRDAMVAAIQDVPATRPDLVRLSLVAQILVSMHDAMPVKLSADAVDFCAEVANLSTHLVGKTYRGTVISPAVIGHACVVACTLGMIGEHACASAVTLLRTELMAMTTAARVTANDMTAVLGGIASLSGQLDHDAARAVADWNRQTLARSMGASKGYLANAELLVALAGADNLRRKAAELRAPGTNVLAAGLCEADTRELYGINLDYSLFYHSGHTWLKPIADEQFAVGLDDFALRLVGKVDRVRLPEAGTRVHQGEVVCHVERDGQTVGILAPVTGTVVSVNNTVAEVIAASPEADAYETAWLFTIKPEKIDAEVGKLLKGARVVEFNRNEVRSLIMAMTPGSKAAAMDGAVLKTDLLAGVANVDWQATVKRFLRS
jgi:glycine cleavage system H protein